MARPGRPERNRAARSFRQLRRSITSSTQIRFSVHTGHFQPSRCDCRPLIAVWLYHGCLRDADQRGTWGDAIGDGARVLRRAGYAVDAEPDRGWPEPLLNHLIGAADERGGKLESEA